MVTWSFSKIMLGGILVIFLSAIVSFAVIGRLKAKLSFIDESLLKRLFFYHLLLALAYYGYVTFNPSDSKAYYEKVMIGFRGNTWMDFYGTSTTFIEFIGYPFIRFLGFSYEGMMALFSLFGYLGFVFFYVFFRENLRFNHKIYGVDFLTLIFFLPNLHFWSSSFGKGSIIFLGIGLFFYGVSKIRSRIIAILVGGVIIYHVRPHVMLVMLISASIGFIFSSKGVSTTWKVAFLLGCSLAFFFIYKDVLSLVGIDEEQFVTQGLDLTHRAKELSKATSGVDITKYSLPMQLFTFLYRPLFVDAPGALGLIVSFENVFYLAITLKLLSNLRGIKYLFTCSFLVKSALLSFLTVSLAIAQVSGNLGIAMRQKSQVMILLMFVVISYMDDEKFRAWKERQMHKRMSKPPITPSIKVPL